MGFSQRLAYVSGGCGTEWMFSGPFTGGVEIAVDLSQFVAPASVAEFSSHHV
jgi:hypothetical protein